MKIIVHLPRSTTAKSLACFAGERASDVFGAMLSVDGGQQSAV